MNRIRDSLYGLAIGDALGFPIKYEHRDALVSKPVTKMICNINDNLDKGLWSDDTSLTLATMDAIAIQKKVDYEEIARRFCLWINDGMYTPNGEIVDISHATKEALTIFYNDHVDAFKCGNGISDNGNGALVRMMPIAFYAYYKKLDDDRIFDIVKNVSSITNAHEISIMGSYMFVKYLLYILNGYDKITSFNNLRKLDYRWFSNEAKSEYRRILSDDLIGIEVDDIYSTGYVVYTLEAVLWIILNTSSYSEALIGAINLGEETDTIGALTGCIAGLLYGYDDILEEWINDLKNKEYLDYMARKYSKAMELI